MPTYVDMLIRYHCGLIRLLGIEMHDRERYRVSIETGVDPEPLESLGAALNLIHLTADSGPVLPLTTVATWEVCLSRTPFAYRAQAH